jgi:hypothetical protein
MDKRNNPLRRGAFIFICIGIIGIIIIFVPWIIKMPGYAGEIDGFNGGAALSAAGALINLICMCFAVILLRQASLIDRMVIKGDTLAHWTYSPEEWKKYTERARRKDIDGKFESFLIIAVIAIFAFIIASAASGYNIWIIALIILGILAVIGLLIYLSASANYRYNKKYIGETYISNDGIYFNRQIHAWKMPNTRLEEIKYDDSEKNNPIIIFVYSMKSRYGSMPTQVSIPVPHGQEDSARHIVQQITSTNLEKI